MELSMSNITTVSPLRQRTIEDMAARSPPSAGSMVLAFTPLAGCR